jgi:hypothetical protein
VFSWGSMPQYYSNETKQMILHKSVPMTNMKIMIEDFINTIK